jgi:predicted porin
MKIQHTILAASMLVTFAAQAQTSVTVYGNADLALNNFSTTSTTGAKNQDNNIVAGGLSTSNIGFRGEREIATGLKATFQFEFEVDQTVEKTEFKSRAGLVGLSGNIGALTIGRRTTLMKSTIDALDAGDGTNTAGFIGDNARDSRLDDRITYSSPVFSGFSADVQIGLGSTPKDTTAAGVVSTTNNGKKDDSMSYALNFVSGPLTARMATETIKGNSSKKVKIGTGADSNLVYQVLAPSVTTDDRKNDAFGATYDFGVAKVFFVDTKMKQGSGSTMVTFDTQTLGVRVPFGDYTVVAEAGNGKAKLTDSTIKANVEALQLTLMYSLAKDTTVYFAYGSESIAHPSFTKKGEQTNTQIGLRYKF